VPEKETGNPVNQHNFYDTFIPVVNLAAVNITAHV
jgi:hypothetical protein